ncbi:MAG: hypothetical protein WDN48_07920 [Pseudolabrys sp.]
MSKRAEIERMVPFAVDALGGLDVLINNAASQALRCRSSNTRPTTGTRWSPSTSPACSTCRGWRFRI